MSVTNYRLKECRQLIAYYTVVQCTYIFSVFMVLDCGIMYNNDLKN